MYDPIPAPAAFEVRSVIKFLNAQGIATIEIYRQLCQVYGPNVMMKPLLTDTPKIRTLLIHGQIFMSQLKKYRNNDEFNSRLRPLSDTDTDSCFTVLKLALPPDCGQNLDLKT
ncbi:hypothetical protein ANN_05228 [Periplaneta americana]|uniref:Uncharacterized protein n=1 Tax=Periplaneta americana TaxID=6978 RepID=A0ABQ8TCI5_PERAM|nr:hypothetical protein ANN_05228 [Periplaneta americana]